MSKIGQGQFDTILIYTIELWQFEVEVTIRPFYDVTPVSNYRIMSTLFAWRSNPTEYSLYLISAIYGNLIEAGQIIVIDVLDHIIIGDNKHLSMKAKGLF